MQTILLASGSRYRAALLNRLGLPFTAHASNVDERPHAGESAADLAIRLARLKAKTLSASQSTGLVIGSDQVAECNGGLLGKPGGVAEAEAQLAACQGQRVSFYTAVHVLDIGSGATESSLDTTVVQLRQLDTSAIRRYVAADRPLDCAGSFKVESLGISLFEKIETTDPTALVGLPLISVGRALRHFGVVLP